MVRFPLYNLTATWGLRLRVSKRGSPVLRRVIWLAAVSARHYNPELKAYYEGKIAGGKHPSVATGAVARRLLHVVYAVWKQNRPFRQDYQWTPAGGSS